VFTRSEQEWWIAVLGTWVVILFVVGPIALILLGGIARLDHGHMEVVEAKERFERLKSDLGFLHVRIS